MLVLLCLATGIVTTAMIERHLAFKSVPTEVKGESSITPASPQAGH